MPWPIDYHGGQKDDQTRSVDKVVIEPSIREGLFLVSSLYGPLASAPIRRYPPVNLSPPFITGSPKIPSTLTCQTGQWDASPYPFFYFQWMKNGVDLPGQTNQTLQTDSSMDNSDITCEVRAATYLAEAYAFTAPIHVTIIEPIEVRDYAFGVVTGIQLSQNIITHMTSTTFLTGMGALNAMTITRGISYFLSGMGAITRMDMEQMNLSAISGIGSKTKQQIIDWDFYAVSKVEGLPLVSGEAQFIPLKNNNAECGLLGWNVFGICTYSDLEQEGSFSWYGGNNADAAHLNVPYSYIWQDVDLYPIWFADIDSGQTYLNVSWYQRTEADKDQGNVRVEFLNQLGNVISDHNGPGLSEVPYIAFWMPRTFNTLIPSGTRKIRFYAEFNLIGGTNNDSRIDYILPTITKGTPQTGVNVGPSFKQFRLNFTRLNSGGYVSLSEIEMRTTVGGGDACADGIVISGSQTIDGNAVNAFDNMRNGSYWAAELNAVEQGKAWIGYKFDQTKRIKELEITARNGFPSLFVGRDFTFEGSMDGFHWFPIQTFYEIPSFASEERKTFAIREGNFDWWGMTALSAYSNPTNTTGTSASGNTIRQRGMVFQAKARLAISDLMTCINANSSEVTIGISKVIYESGYPLTVGPLQTYTFPANFTTSYWHTVTLDSPFYVEPGEFFVIYGSCQDAVSAKGTRMWDVYANTGASYPLIKGSLVMYQHEWAGYEPVLKTNMRTTSKQTYYYAVDFKGSIF